MAEWLKAHAWKACIRETVSWVRIPLSPPDLSEVPRLVTLARVSPTGSNARNIGCGAAAPCGACLCFCHLSHANENALCFGCHMLSQPDRRPRVIIEFTGRQYEVTPAIRTQVERGLNKLIKILGQNFKTNVILTAEKYRQIAEITIKIRNHAIVGAAENGDMTSAVGEALTRIERQALKYKGRWRARKRQPKRQLAAEVESPTATSK